jgi:hypothetical protein
MFLHLLTCVYIVWATPTPGHHSHPPTSGQQNLSIFKWHLSVWGLNYSSLRRPQRVLYVCPICAYKFAEVRICAWHTFFFFHNFSCSTLNIAGAWCLLVTWIKRILDGEDCWLRTFVGSLLCYLEIGGGGSPKCCLVWVDDRAVCLTSTRNLEKLSPLLDPFAMGPFCSSDSLP